MQDYICLKPELIQQPFVVTITSSTAYLHVDEWINSYICAIGVWQCKH